MKYSDGIKDIAVRLQDDVPITAEEMDCLGLRYMDALLIIIAFYLGSLFLSAAVPILIKTFIHGAKLTVYVFNTIFSFGVALEVQTTAGIKNTYQDWYREYIGRIIGTNIGSLLLYYILLWVQHIS